MPDISVDPASHDFGDINVGASAPITLTVRSPNDADGSHTISLRDEAAAFTASPSTLTLAPGETETITIAFAPTARTTYLASLIATPTGQGGPERVVDSIRGTGVQEVPAAPETVQDVDGVTFYEVRLDNYASTTFERANETDSAEDLTAFLRIGSFDLDKESTRSLELLNLIPQAGPATNPYGLSSNVSILERDGVAGTIFADDIRTRPQDVIRIGQTDAVFGDNALQLSTQDDPGNKLTVEQRHRESSRLYSRGGWRDHSDGNRITTTYGDKVEVIRGNYKLVVMGRQDNVEEAIGWEGSGSHVQDYAPGTMPGASFWLEWINDPRYYAPLFGPTGEVDPTETSQKGVWLLVNTTQNVYEYARYAGNFREERWGDVIETYIGSENPPTNGAFAIDSVEGTKGHEPPERLDDRNYDLPEEHAASNELRNVPLFSEDNIGAVRSNPHIIERIWAERIDRTLGSPATPISAGIFEELHTREFKEVFIAETKIYEERKAPLVETYLEGKVVERFQGDHIEMFQGTHTELFLGLNTSIKAGGFIDITIGGMELNIDMVLQRTQLEIAYSSIDIDIARHKVDVECYGTNKDHFTLTPVKNEIGTGIKNTINAGSDFGMYLGEKIKMAAVAMYDMAPAIFQG